MNKAITVPKQNCYIHVNRETMNMFTTALCLCFLVLFDTKVIELLFTGPRPDWDPDIVAALDDDFDYNDPENQLEDDFISMANTGEGPRFEEGYE